MSKRKRFVITSIILSLGFIGIQFIENRYRFISIGSLSILTIILYYWSLREGLGKNSTLLSLVLPTLFTLGVGLFWFLLPSNIFTRIPIIIFYGLGIYSLCLTSNIYTVAAIRTIALLRAARGVGFVLTLVTSFLLFDTILSIKGSIITNVLFVFIASYPLFLQGLWVMELEEKVSKAVFYSSLVFSLLLAQIAASLFFWPVRVVVGSLFLTVILYVLLGLGQAKIEGRLFRQTVREYLIVGIVVFLGIFLVTRWSL